MLANAWTSEARLRDPTYSNSPASFLDLLGTQMFDESFDLLDRADQVLAVDAEAPLSAFLPPPPLPPFALGIALIC